MPPEVLLEPEDAIILFHLPRDVKDSLVNEARKRNFSITKLLNDLISGFLKPKKPTGRGHTDLDQIEKAKEILRMRHPEGVRAIEIADHVGCDNARARGLMDLLSEKTESNPDFLVCEDGGRRSTLYYIYRDDKLGIKP
jgi:hypothetical protein